jgi:hypothetical protein
MRRRGRSPTRQFEATNSAFETSSDDDDEDDDGGDTMMDTDEQDELIRSMEEDAQKQSQLFQTAFSLVGGFAMVTSLFVYPFVCHDECSQRLLSCWTHAIISSGTHGLSIKISRSMNRCYPRRSADDADNGGDDDVNSNYDKDPLIPIPPPPFSFAKSTLFGILVLLHVAPLLLWVMGGFDQDVEHFHLGLLLGNLVTLLGSFLLLWDLQSTRQALSDLNGAKYEHKSL